MIPARIVEFINSEVDMGMVGTRDAANRPRAHRAFGLIASEDGKRLRALIPRFSLEGLAEAIAENGQVAISAGNTVSHETYQMKGKASAPTEPSEADVAMFAEYTERIVRAGVAIGMPEELLRAIIQPPERVITLEVETIFLQTPGPGAGQPLSEVEGT